MAYADVNGLSLYYAEQGDGPPLVLLHGGIGAGEMFDAVAPALAAAGRRVIAVDLQAHGHTADVDRPLRPAHLADDVAALIEHLGLGAADVLGYSLGAMVALRLAIQRPALVRRLVLVSVTARRDGSFPEVLEAMDQMSVAVAEPMRQSPVYAAYAANAPRPEDWPVLIGRISELLKIDYDWTAELGAIALPVLLVYADADSVRPEHIAELFGLLGGGLRDGGLDGSGRSTAQLAILPGFTHYDILASPALVPAVLGFLER